MISEGITSIGNDNFTNNCMEGDPGCFASKIKVSLPGSLKRIGKYAFNNYGEPEFIFTVPKRLKLEIGEDAFPVHQPRLKERTGNMFMILLSRINGFIKINKIVAYIWVKRIFILLQIFIFVLTAYANLALEVQAKEYLTLIKDVPKDTDLDEYYMDVISNTESGIRTYHIFRQYGMDYPEDYPEFIKQHGCAVCSLTTVLSAYSNKYKKYIPEETYKKLEKKVFGNNVWNANYTKNMRYQRPISLFGISTVLNYVGIPNEYIRFFQNQKAVGQIEKHLKTGNAVIIETNNQTQKDGVSDRKKTTKWAYSKHTMVLMGMTTDGRVMVADSADYKWSGKRQRVKLAKMSELIRYMFPCKGTSYSKYFNGVQYSGGYVLVNKD